MSIRVFVSHSAKEPAAERVQRKLIEALKSRPAEFTALMDKTDLRAGDPWRARINLWLGACDAAVILLSRSALESPFVQYEASILAYRNATSAGQFLIIPVFIEHVDENALEQSRLDPAQLNASQGVRGTPKQIVERVLERLAGRVPMAEVPIERTARRVTSLLMAVPTTNLPIIEQKLGIEPEWDPHNSIRSDARFRIALRLLSIGMEAALPALLELRPDVKDRMRQLIKYVASSWVDLSVVGRLPEVGRSSPRRAVSLNAESGLTAEMYKISASCGDDSWYFVQCTDVVGEPPLRMPAAPLLIERVKAALMKRLRCDGETELHKDLESLSASHVVLAAIPAEGMSEQILREMKNAFPTVTFFLLSGEKARDLPDISRELVEVLHPPLMSKEEHLFCVTYDDFERQARYRPEEKAP